MPTAPPCRQRPRCTIVSASVGAGHNAAARAIAETLQPAADLMDVEVLDLMDLAPRWFRAYYAQGYALAMSRLPKLYGLAYKLSDKPQTPQRSWAERCRLKIEALGARRLAERLSVNKPDLIVHTHFLAPPVVGKMLLQSKLSGQQFVVVTDVDAHRFWYADQVDQWFCSGPAGAAALGRWGIDHKCVTISGMPVSAKWTAPLDRQRILDEWKLPPDAPIILLSGGMDFTCGPVARLAGELLATFPKAHVVAMAGRNKKLLAQLARLPQASGKCHVVAYTDRLHELAEVSSLMITKPGGATTAECIARGTAMVLLRPVGGQESRNAEFLADSGAAVIAKKYCDVAGIVAGLLDDRQTLETLVANGRKLYRPAAATIARAICQQLDIDPAILSNT